MTYPTDIVISEFEDLQLLKIAREDSDYSNVAISEIVRRYTPLCKRIAKEIIKLPIYNEDAIQSAYLGLLNATKKHDLITNSFGAFAVGYIKKEIYYFLKQIRNPKKEFTYESDQNNSSNDPFDYLKTTQLRNYDTPGIIYYNYQNELNNIISIKPVVEDFKINLTETQKELFYLFFIKGKKPIEIQKTMNISKQRFYQIFNRIKKLAIPKFSFTIN